MKTGVQVGDGYVGIEVFVGTEMRIRRKENATHRWKQLAGLGCRGSRHWTLVLSVISELWKGGQGSYLPSSMESKS